MDPVLRLRLATRLARALRAQGAPKPLTGLAEALGLWGPWPPLLLPLLDGRFYREGEVVGLWEWRYPFPPRGEALVVLDLETTGLAPEVGEIIEIGFVRLEGLEAVRFSRLVRPSRPPSPFIQNLTGLTWRALAEAPSLEEVLEEAYPLLEGAVWAMHNAPFDLAFLEPALKRLGHPIGPALDTLRLSRRAFPGLRRYGLDALSQALDLPARGVHRALADAERTWTLLHEVYYALSSGRPRPLAELGR